MNAEQLHTVASTVVEDIHDTSVLSGFSLLSKHLNGLTGDPGNEDLQRNVQSAKKELFASLESLKEKRWPAGLRQAVIDLGGEVLVSENIKSDIDLSFQTEAITPAIVRELVDGYRSDIERFLNKMSALKDAFEALEIEEKKLGPSEVELGVLVPRHHVGNHLHRFAREVAAFDEALKMFSVVATGTREDFEITYISASDLRFFIRPTLVTALLVGAVVSEILECFNQVADLKLKVEEIKQLGMEDKHLESVHLAIDQTLNQKIDELLPSLVDEYSSEKADHDKNENRVRLRHAIEFVAPRLERGFVIELRVGPLPGPDDEDYAEDGGREEEQHVEQNLIDRLEDQAQRLRHLEPIGEPILALKEPEWPIAEESPEWPIAEESKEKGE